MKKNIISLIILFTAILFSACSGIKDFENYTGKSIVIAAGDTAIVKMSADTHNGYEWIEASNSDPGVAVYAGKQYLSAESNTEQSSQVIKFKGLKKGKTIITLNYVKPGDLIVKKSRTVKITVY